jgi:hypothetical protein
LPVGNLLPGRAAILNALQIHASANDDIGMFGSTLIVSF